MKKILVISALFVFTAFFCLSGSEARSHRGYHGYMHHNDYYGVYRTMPYYHPIAPYEICHRPYYSYGNYYPTPYYNYYYPQPYGGLWNFGFYSY